MTIYLHPADNTRKPGDLNDPSQDDESIAERDLNPPCVLVFNASDPSGAGGLGADALAMARDCIQRGQRFDVIFLDPPYQQDFLTQALPLCAQLLNEGGLVYAESGERLPFAEDDTAADDVPDWLQSWQLVRADKAGMVHYHLLKLH